MLKLKNLLFDLCTSRFLSAFCTKLTGIRQEDVDGAAAFPEVFASFLEWIGDEAFIWCSWGGYDLRQLEVDCRRHSIAMPPAFQHHINLKKAFARLRGIKPCGMKRALAILGIPLEGRHHRAIDDVRNVAKLARAILPCLEGGVNEAG